MKIILSYNDRRPEGLQVHHTQLMYKTEATREGSVSKLTN